MENSTCRADCGCIHGLSLYLETPRHRILFDMGPNELFWTNATHLGIDLSRVDTAFLSHGHYDHAGGLTLFCQKNQQAPIYMHPLALGPYYAKEGEQFRYIGVDPQVKNYQARFRTTSGYLDEELFLFDGIDTHDFTTNAAASLLEKTEDTYFPDAFRHEQNLIVSAEGKQILFAGCAHNGIVDILRKAEGLVGELDYVFAGFHLTDPGQGVDEPRALVEAVGQELKQRRTQFITGHCTGKQPYLILREILGNQITDMPAGRVFKL